jgi:hypothetical protein
MMGNNVIRGGRKIRFFLMGWILLSDGFSDGAAYATSISNVFYVVLSF